MATARPTPTRRRPVKRGEGATARSNRSGVTSRPREATAPAEAPPVEENPADEVVSDAAAEETMPAPGPGTSTEDADSDLEDAEFDLEDDSDEVGTAPVDIDEPGTDLAGSEPSTDDAAALDDPALDDPALDDPVLDDPVLDDPVLDDPVLDDPVLDDPAVDDAALDDAAVYDLVPAHVEAAHVEAAFDDPAPAANSEETAPVPAPIADMIAPLADALKSLVAGLEREVVIISGLSGEIDGHVEALNGLRADMAARLVHLDALRDAAVDAHLGAYLDDTIVPTMPQAAEEFPERIYGEA